jgi:hypothetical protein
MKGHTMAGARPESLGTALTGALAAINRSKTAVVKAAAEAFGAPGPAAAPGAGAKAAEANKAAS